MFKMKKKLISIIQRKLKQNSSALVEQYFSKNEFTKTKFFYIDNLLPISITQKIYEAFPKEIFPWDYNSSFRERGYGFAKLDEVDSILSDITEVFHNKEILSLISGITKINGLEADPTLYASGISKLAKGNFINPHIDNSHDAYRKRYRRLNLLFYVTPHHKETDGGCLELWDDKVLRPFKINSKFNRLVVMETSSLTWHSVEPVTSIKPRLAISGYYFSKKSPSKTDYYHVTSFTGRPEQRIKRIYGVIDNYLRNTAAKVFKVGRGKNLRRSEAES